MSAAGLNLDQVAEFLLRNQYLLTSLELHQESIERGQELQRLKTLFTPSKLDGVIATEEQSSWNAATAIMRPPRGNAGKGTPGAQTTVELANRVALLEYELRQERQTIQELRSELSKQFAAKESLPSNQVTDASAYRKTQPASSIESRILNHLIKKYLISQGYKLTAISLASESLQDLDHWSSASSEFGLNLPEPPPLVNLYRYFYGAINNTEEHKAVYAALERSVQAISQLKSDLAEQERRVSVSQQTIALLEEKLKNGGKAAPVSTSKASESEEALKARENQRLAEEKANEAQRQVQTTAEIAAAKEQAKKRIPKRTRDYAFLFTRDESEIDDNSRRISAEVIKMREMSNDNTAAVTVLGSTLPEIVPGVILKKREELIPAIVATICWHPDERKRMDMSYMLFNLIKVPNAQQRRVIMDGCVNLAALTGEERTGTELLPLAVEAIASPHEERRMLCAEACGWLAPNVQHEMRISLLLSILHQLSQDRSANVRAAAVVNLARLLVLEDKDKNTIDHNSNSNNATESSKDATAQNGTDEKASTLADTSTRSGAVLTIDPKKYQQLCDMILALLQDPDNNVLQVTRTTLLPVFGDFVERMQLLESKYLPSVVSRMLNIVSKARGQPDSKSSHELDVNAEALVYLAPVLYENALLQTDFYEEVSRGFRGPKYVTGSKYVKSVSAFTEDEKRVLGEKFAEQIEKMSSEELLNPPQKNPADWTVFDWLLRDFLPSIVQMVCDVDTNNSVVMNAICNTLSTFTQEFGETFTRRAVQPRFTQKLASLMNQPDQVRQRGRIAVVYLVAVVTGLDEKDVSTHLKQFILDIALSQNGWTPEQYSSFEMAILCLLEQFDDHKETLITTISELLVHEDARVRRTIIKVFTSLISVLSTTEITSRVVPVLITMANDSDINVRCDVIVVLGELAIIIQDSHNSDRITSQLESFISDSPKFKTVQQLIKTYAKIIPSVTPAFRDGFILKQLVRLGKYAVDDEDNKRQKELAEPLFDAYRALNGMSIGRDSLKNNVVPGLKHLQKMGEVLPADKRNVINNMISIMEQITVDKSSTPRKSLDGKEAPAPGSSTVSSTLGGFFQGWSKSE